MKYEPTKTAEPILPNYKLVFQNVIIVIIVRAIAGVNN